MFLKSRQRRSNLVSTKASARQILQPHPTSHPPSLGGPLKIEKRLAFAISRFGRQFPISSLLAKLQRSSCPASLFRNLKSAFPSFLPMCSGNSRQAYIVIDRTPIHGTLSLLLKHCALIPAVGIPSIMTMVIILLLVEIADIDIATTTQSDGT